MLDAAIVGVINAGAVDFGINAYVTFHGDPVTRYHPLTSANRCKGLVSSPTSSHIPLIATGVDFSRWAFIGYSDNK